MTNEMHGNQLAVVGRFKETNRLAESYRVEVGESSRIPVDIKTGSTELERLGHCLIETPSYALSRSDGASDSAEGSVSTIANRLKRIRSSFHTI